MRELFRRYRTVLLVLLGIVIIAACIIPILSGPPGGRPGGPGGPGGGGPFGSTSQVSLQKTTIDRGDLRLTVSATGSIVATQQAKLAFKSSSKVIAVNVQEGQRVQAGQILATLDDTTAKANLAQAEYTMQAADAALQKILGPVEKKDIDNAEANVKAAQLSYTSSANSTSTYTIQAYELQYQQAQASVTYAETERRNAGGRYGNDDPNYQKYVAQVGSAQISAETARLNLEKAKRGSWLLAATAKIAQMQAKLAQVKAGPRQSEIDATQADYVSAKLSRDRAAHDVADVQLVAPFAGVVTNVNIKAGQNAAGTAITLTDTSVLYADINVDEADIGKVQVGLPVELTVDALTDVKLTGKVQRVTQLADDETASVIKYTVRIALDNTSAPLKVTMTTNATFVVRDLKNVVRVPNQYLRVNDNKQTTVYVVNPDGSLSEVVVSLGLQGTDYSEVIGGLREGDTVALAVSANSK